MIRTVTLFLLLFVLGSPCRAQPQSVTWADLSPAAIDQPAPGSSTTDVHGDVTNATLVGREIELKGYLLPVDREGDNVYEFLLVPVPGACSHTPAPPPNQIAHVSLRQPYVARAMYEPVAVRGILRAEDTTTQLFILDGVKVVETAYSIGLASVSAATDMPPVQSGNPLLARRSHANTKP